MREVNHAIVDSKFDRKSNFWLTGVDRRNGDLRYYSRPEKGSRSRRSSGVPLRVMLDGISAGSGLSSGEGRSRPLTLTACSRSKKDGHCC